MSNASRPTPFDTVVDLVAATASRRLPPELHDGPSLVDRLTAVAELFHLPDYASRTASNDPTGARPDVLERYY